MNTISPISNVEFMAMMQRCLLPSGWYSRIAVANSGGADSTCLLFLLRRLHHHLTTSYTDPEHSHNPELHQWQSLQSFHVDHRLQATSHQMAEVAKQNARRLKVWHFDLAIPWGTPPYPPQPGPGMPVEAIAREARAHALFERVARSRIDAIAYGHHADDQVETALLRVAKGSTALGLAGMRRVRRWGMGMGAQEGALAWAGYEGMRHYVIRPLLGVTKDRIIATCEAHALRYVRDPTNFQPAFTLRNAIRHVLKDPDSSAPDTLPKTESETADDNISAAKNAVKEMVKLSKELVPPQPSTADLLRTAVDTLSMRMDQIEAEVTKALYYPLKYSPPGTILLNADDLTATAHADPLVKTAMVLRILRYVSPRPWGSIEAQAHRRTASISNAIERLWDTDLPHAQRLSFVNGAFVQWTPLRLCTSGELKFGEQRPGDYLCWIASRAPPDKRTAPLLSVDVSRRLREWLEDESKEGAETEAEAEAAETEVEAEAEADRTGKDAYKDAQKPVRVLWDNRFSIAFRPDRFPSWLVEKIRQGGRVMIVPDTQAHWNWPKIVHPLGDGKETVLARMAFEDMRWRDARGGPQKPRPWKYSPFVSMKFIRVLDAI